MIIGIAIGFALGVAVGLASVTTRARTWDSQRIPSSEIVQALKEKHEPRR